MEKVMNILKPKPNPQQLLRDWQRRLRQECRNMERQIRDIQREEKNVQKAIKEAAKRNDMGSAKELAKELVRSRKTVNRLYENKAQLNSISMHLGESVAVARTVGHLSKSAEVMKLVNNLMKAPQMAVTMQEFSKEMTKAGVIEEMVNEAVDYALDSEDIEEETEEEIEKVLTAIAGETAAQLPEAVRKQKLKQPATSEEVEVSFQSFYFLHLPLSRIHIVVYFPNDMKLQEKIDDEEEMEEIRARLARVRS
ncbi:vacuolar protein sorting-associated protein 24 homolog 1-like isoform X1 [Salvia miltiorrhiza]|uniref:vacuolar protein sorting-associated protein 24 homolog 1-like isoform X1 n=1 Tax=Salvia miltiorrhiza TaxID=226208 RepID=UPI0025AC2BB4|nr:vacuolar protein sorting-associated protein 24 homolog 1-like isoform X1 [Salvia miltiorrhiza]